MEAFTKIGLQTDAKSYSIDWTKKINETQKQLDQIKKSFSEISTTKES